MKIRLLWFVCAAALASTHGLAQSSLRFTDAGAGSYSFDTGVLSGKLRNEGKSVGLLPVTWVATGEVLTRSMGFAGHYRVFSGSQRFVGGGAWYWPSKARLLDDGAVEVTWADSDERPFQLSAVYRWVQPAVLDVETRVLPRIDLPDFESFLAFYFNEKFTESSVLSDEKLIPAEQSEGAWQMFPRDSAAVRLIQDGRWKVPPNPVEWTLRPFSQQVGVRRAESSGLTALMMCRDCFAVATPHQAEGHYSMYLSLFGKTLRKGESASAHARMILLPSAATPTQIERWYDDFTRNRAPLRKAR